MLKNTIIYTLWQLRQAFLQAREMLQFGPIIICCIKPFDVRTLKQNATLHMWFSDIARAFVSGGINEFSTGEKIDQNSVKKHLKFTFLPAVKHERINFLTGEVEEYYEPRRTSTLPKGDMCFFMDQIRAWAIENQIKLTIPEGCEYHRHLQEMGESI